MIFAKFQRSSGNRERFAGNSLRTWIRTWKGSPDAQELEFTARKSDENFALSGRKSAAGENRDFCEVSLACGKSRKLCGKCFAHIDTYLQRLPQCIARRWNLSRGRATKISHFSLEIDDFRPSAKIVIFTKFRWSAGNRESFAGNSSRTWIRT